MTKNLSVAIATATTIRDTLPDGGVICLGGLGAAGKSSFSSVLKEAFNGEADTYHGDGFQLQDSVRRKLPVDKMGNTPTGCHPDAYDDRLAAMILKQIKSGQAVPQLDPQGVDPSKTNPKVTGTFRPHKWNIVEGLCCLHTHFLTKSFVYDYTMFLDCSVTEEKRRRFQRDLARGKKLADIEDIFAGRRLQYETFVEPYRENCNLHLRSRKNYSIEIV